MRSEEMEDYENKGRLALWLSGHIERLGENTDGVKGGLTPLRKAILNWMFVAVICTFFANSANIILHALVKEGWWCGQDVVVCRILKRIPNTKYKSLTGSIVDFDSLAALYIHPDTAFSN